MLHPITPGNRPFETVNIDQLGPLPVSTKGNAYILVLVDNLTKFVKLYPIKNCAIICSWTAEVVHRRPRNGVPVWLLQPVLRSQWYRTPCTISAPPPIEWSKWSKTTKMCNEATWGKNLSELELNLNTAPNQTTGVSPFSPYTVMMFSKRMGYSTYWQTQSLFISNQRSYSKGCAKTLRRSKKNGKWDMISTINTCHWSWGK